MTINYDEVKAAVKALGTATDNDAFLEGFLSAFNFPQATYNRLIAGTKGRANQGLRIQGNGGIYFLPSTAANLNSEFNILKKNNDMSKIKEAFIVIANDTDILAFERDSGGVLETSKNELHRYIEFFFPLLGIKREAASDEMKSADSKAAEQFAELYNELGLRNHNHSGDIAELLCRLLFCCFADSIGVLAVGGLRPLLSTYTEGSGSDTSAFFCNLFESMKSESRKGLPGYFAKVNYVDARLFGEALPLLDFSKKARGLVLDLMAIDWSEVSPDILGTIIQSIVREDAENSSNNYTTTANIQKVINPLFMDKLYRNFERVRGSREGCEALLRRIKAITVFDPSSGAGNFLLVAFKELSKLAHKVNDAIKSHNVATTFDFMPSALRVAESSSYDTGTLISWRNFYGIDDDSFSCAIARLGFLFVVCQEARDYSDVTNVFKNTIDVLFSDNIVVGNATRINWETVCQGAGETYIVGNPSYTGARKQSSEQKADLQHVFADYTGISNLDYAACWFMLATKYICANGGGFAFVTTNSLTQGEQVQLLWPKLFEKGIHIRFAYTSFKWKNDARNRTAVTVVVIGVVLNRDTEKRELFTSMTIYEPRSISPYLVAGNTIVKKRTTPISNLPKMVKGNMPLYWAKHILSHTAKEDVVSRDPRTEKFLKRIVGGDELIDGIEKWCFWIHDDELEEAMSIPIIAEKVEFVRQARLSSTDKSARKHASKPHQFREMRETNTQSLVIPEVSSEQREYFQVEFKYKDTIIESTNYVIYDCEPWIFGLVSSKMHNLWIRTVCGALETRIRYSPRLGYNTFPFPDITQEQKGIIRGCVLGVIRARERYVPQTLAQLYNEEQMPSDLIESHIFLDKVVESCYRQTPFTSNQERLECLFDLYNKLGG